jgi:MarR family transcriptional regulator, transcriptional regulator for hemolysin
MNEEIEFLMCDTASLWRRLFNAETKSIGVTHVERRIIISVSRHPGATQIEIANLLEIEPQNLIRPLDKLVTENLIEKRSDVKDRRSNCLFITSSCRAILTRIDKMADKVRPIALSGLSEKEIERLKIAILQIKNNLESYLIKS